MKYPKNEYPFYKVKQIYFQHKDSSTIDSVPCYNRPRVVIDTNNDPYMNYTPTKIGFFDLLLLPIRELFK